MKFHPKEEHQFNSPWNIAADFTVEMDFKAEDIAGMLCEYENNHFTGMDIIQISRLIYEYTFGYPYLVSKICQLVDERIADVTKLRKMFHVKHFWRTTWI